MPPPSLREAVKSPPPRGCQHAGGMLAYSRRLSGGVSATSIKAETNIENIGLNLDNRIKIFGHVIAQYSMRRGVAPSLFPTAGTTFPLDTILLTLRFFLFPRRGLFTPSVTLRVPPPSCREAILHVTREFTVVAGPVCGQLYIEVNAYVITKYFHRKRVALHKIKCLRSI